MKPNDVNGDFPKRPLETVSSTTKNPEKGISIITCSIEPKLCNRMIESVKNTIGTPFETIIFDNREKGFGICHVYNMCAQKAKFPYLCFIHEDIIMPTQNWGRDMVLFAEQTDRCGIIGFAGGRRVKKNFICWWEGQGQEERCRFYDLAVRELRLKYNNPDNAEFAQVITLDGLFLFVRKEIWKNNPFDEDTLKGFHFYDADFSFGISRKYQNYVYLKSDIYHFSEGNINKAFYEAALIFQKKWKKELPSSMGNRKISLKEEMNSVFNLHLHAIQSGVKIKSCINHIIEVNGYFFFFLMPVLFLVEIVKKVYRLLMPRLVKEAIFRMRKIRPPS